MKNLKTVIQIKKEIEELNTFVNLVESFQPVTLEEQSSRNTHTLEVLKRLRLK